MAPICDLFVFVLYTLLFLVNSAFLSARFCVFAHWLFSTRQPFVLTAATTSSCSTRKGSVPETSMPSSWRWPMRKSDLWPPLRTLATVQPVFCYFFLNLFFVLEEVGEAPCCTSYLDRLCERASNDGRTKMEKHRLWGKPQQQRRTGGITNRGEDFSLSDSRGFWTEGHGCWIYFQTKHKNKRGKLFFWNDPTPLFKMSSEEFTKDGYF